MELQKLTKAIWDTSRRIEKVVNELGKRAKEYAEAEKEYRLALGREILILRGKSTNIYVQGECIRLAKVTYKTWKEMLQVL
ncbi:hypothetical protein NRP93_002505 [Clostridium botulinum]|nr:hypothetical protein [Clostridium botulinum]